MQLISFVERLRHAFAERDRVGATEEPIPQTCWRLIVGRSWFTHGFNATAGGLEWPT